MDHIESKYAHKYFMNSMSFLAVPISLYIYMNYIQITFQKH